MLWDTHIYTPNADTVDDALELYESDLSKIATFQSRQAQDVLIGEFALSNL